MWQINQYTHEYFILIIITKLLFTFRFTNWITYINIYTFSNVCLSAQKINRSDEKIIVCSKLYRKINIWDSEFGVCVCVTAMSTSALNLSTEINEIIEMIRKKRNANIWFFRMYNTRKKIILDILGQFSLFE